MKKKSPSKPKGRGLRPGQLRQSYVARRWSDPEFDQGIFHADMVEDDDHDYWDANDPYIDWYQDYHIDQFLNQLLFKRSPGKIGDALQVKVKKETDFEPGWIPFRESSKQKLENRLTDYQHMLESLDETAPEVDEMIERAAGGRGRINLVRSFLKRHTNLAKSICLFSPFWVRDPATAEPENISDLLEHMFVEYEVPRFLYAEWNRMQKSSPRFEWLLWFVLLAQGGSLKRYCEGREWTVSPKFQHHLFDVPAAATPLQGCIYAEVRRAGGSLTDFERILQVPAMVVNPVWFLMHERQGSRFPKFWYSTVSWLVRHRDRITDEQSERILSWAAHLWSELQRVDAQFTWRGRSLERTIQESDEYYETFTKPIELTTWQSHSWNWDSGDLHPDKWTLTELTSGKLLLEESRAMRHCVAAYSDRCVVGASAIFSVRRNGKRQLTVDVNPQRKRATEIKGYGNRFPDEEEQWIVKLWLSRIVQK